MSDIKEIISLLNNPSKEDIELIQKARDFALKAHADQTRNSGEKYFNHLLATAKKIAEIGKENNERRHRNRTSFLFYPQRPGRQKPTHHLPGFQ